MDPPETTAPASAGRCVQRTATYRPGSRGRRTRGKNLRTHDILVAAMIIGFTAAATGGAAENAAQTLGTRTALLVGGTLGLVAVACSPFACRLPEHANETDRA